MKKIIFLFALISTFSSFAQIPEVGHFQQLSSIKRGDTLEVSFYYRPAVAIDVRTFQIDFEFKKSLFTHISSSVDPGVATMTPALSYREWQGYKYTGYTQATQNYNYVQDTSWTVGRNYLILSSGSQISNNGYIIHNKFLINNVPSNFAADSVHINWARLFKVDGTTIGENVALLNNQKLHLELGGNLVINGKVWMSNLVSMRPIVLCTKENTGEFVSLSQVDANGVYSLNNIDKQTKYRLTLRFPSDSLEFLRDNAVTIADAIKSFDEFTISGVDQQFSRQYLRNGLAYLISDINKNGLLDGGDPFLIYASVSGLRKIDTLGLINVFHKDLFDSLAMGQNQWTVWPNYINGVNYILDSVELTNKSIDIKYFILGDVDRSHSSPVFDQFGNVVANAVFRGKFDVDVPNSSSTPGNPVYIPFNVNTNGELAYGLQFEMKYDKTKVKFEEIVTNFNGDPWLQYVTHDENLGVVRFGGMNNQNRGGITGNKTPFKLKFSPIGNGDVESFVYVRQLMDASDKNGDHLNINFASQIASVSYRQSGSAFSFDEVTAKIRPNPTSGWLEVEIHFPDPKMTMLANIYDVQGRLVRKLGEVSGEGYSKIAYKQIDMTSAGNGNYFLVITDGRKSITKQFIKS